MFIIGEVGPVPLLRDAARGWTYFNAQFNAANVEGVTFAGLFASAILVWRIRSGACRTPRNSPNSIWQQMVR